MRIGNGTWVLVADGEKFLLLRNNGNAARVELRVIRHGEVENPPTREQGTDQPGRFNDPAAGRSAVEETDWHRLEKERFAKELAELLRAWALDNRFDALVLAADPAHPRGAAAGAAQGRDRAAGRRARQGPDRDAGARDRGGPEGRLTQRRQAVGG